jgi:hypothetical protein
MVICQMIDLIHRNKVVGVMRIYLEGPGKPADEHDIVAVSVAGSSFGQVPEQVDILLTSDTVRMG